jgi:hypothetical protein
MLAASHSEWSLSPCWQVLAPCSCLCTPVPSGYALPRQLLHCQTARFAVCCLSYCGAGLRSTCPTHVDVCCGTCAVLLRCHVLTRVCVLSELECMLRSSHKTVATTLISCAICTRGRPALCLSLMLLLSTVIVVIQRGKGAYPSRPLRSCQGGMQACRCVMVGGPCTVMMFSEVMRGVCMLQAPTGLVRSFVGVPACVLVAALSFQELEPVKVVRCLAVCSSRHQGCFLACVFGAVPYGVHAANPA